MNFSELISFYINITGFAPYDYQIKVAACLLEGKNVILSVPTGAGKTWASIIPFLFAQQRGLSNFPQKMIYSLPLRALTNSIFSDIVEVVDKLKKNNVSIQTGEYSEDSLFEKEIIFSTIDQTLSSFLSFPLSLSQRQANINAGALVGSYLVFDEFHLLDTELSMATSLGTINLLKNLNRVCIMTATLTDDYMDFIKNNFNFEVVSLKDFPNDVKKIKSLILPPNKSVKKSVHVVSDTKLNIDSILQYHTNKTIVICNRVENVQKIFNELKEKKKTGTLLCIHSRYFDEDRKKIEQQIKTHFGKDSSSKDIILVATQVIEAGMDISCDVMHTEISHINSFLQRAGRCARFEDEEGMIFVYDVLDLDEKEKIIIKDYNDDDATEIRALNNRYLPYNKTICQRTFEALSDYTFLNEEISVSLVNDILGEQERSYIYQIGQRNYNSNKIYESWISCKKNQYRDTIRDIQSVEVILIDIKASKNHTIFPLKYETISVFRWSLYSWAKKMEVQERDSEEWIFAKAEPAIDSVFDFDWADKGTFTLKKLDVEEIKNYSEYPIFVDVHYFGYSDAGFMIIPNKEKKVSPEKQQQVKANTNVTIKKDTYYQHNKGLINCFEIEFKPRLKYLFSVLDDLWGNKIEWEKIIKLILCMHDYGKLNKSWQKPMHTFQKRKSEQNSFFIYNKDEFLAHTDYSDEIDKDLSKKCGLNNKPSHAGIGAIAVYHLLYDDYGEELTKAISCAILKHHSADTMSFDDFEITKTGVEEAQKMLKEIGVNGRLISKESGGCLDEILLNTQNPKEWITYFVLVRILRLCDQKATENLEKYYAYECF